jgi:hypothetical protein
MWSPLVVEYSHRLRYYSAVISRTTDYLNNHFAFSDNLHHLEQQQPTFDCYKSVHVQCFEFVQVLHQHEQVAIEYNRQNDCLYRLQSMLIDEQLQSIPIMVYFQYEHNYLPVRTVVQI